MFFNKNSLFLLFCTLFCSQIQGMEQRDLIMIIDDFMGLREPLERSDMDATLRAFFAALEAKTAPIIVSGSTWRNFATARYNFNKKKDMPNTAESIVYNQIYLPINEELNILGAQYGYDATKLASMITKELTSDSPLHTLFESAIDNIEKLAGTQERIKLAKEFACYGTLFEPTEWSIYTYGNALYILIPHTYAENIHKRYTKNFLQSLQFKDSMGKMLEKEPALLGIKTNNVTKLAVTDAYSLPREKQQIQLIVDEGLPMGALLITHKDTVTAGKLLVIHPFVWNVYLLGHGSYYLDPTNQQQLDEMFLTMEENRKNIEEYTGTIFKYTNAKTLIPKLQLLIQEDQNRLTELGSKDLTQEQATEIENRLEDLKYALANAEQLQQLSTYVYYDIFKNQNINIAGMPANAFTQLLQFLNTQVDTSFLFYETCFGGARNLLYPYLTKAGQAMIYNYIIATGTSSDKITMGLSYILPLAKTTVLSPNNIIIKDKIISLIPNRPIMDFEQFFQGLHASRPFAKTINYVHSDVTSEQLSKSVMRLPGSTNFYVDEIDKLIQKISRVTTSIAKLQGELTIDATQKHAVVIDTYFVPVTVRFKGLSPIMSSIYEPTIQHGSLAGITGYYFKKIIHEGPALGLLGLTNSLTQHAFSNEEYNYHKLGTIDPNVNPIPKIFICDNIFIANTQSTYQKVLIFNKISLPSSITHIESTDNMIVYATGMIYTLNNIPIINAYITTLSTQGKITTQLYGELKDEAVEAYNTIFDETKDDLTQKAIDEGLTIIPLEKMLSTVQGPIRVMAELRNNAHNLGQEVAEKISGKLSQLSAFVEISDMTIDRFATINTSLLTFLNYIKNNPTAVANKATTIRQATFGIRAALDTLYTALEAGLKQLRSNKEADVAKEIERWNELLKQIQVLKRRNADILMRLS